MATAASIEETRVFQDHCSNDSNSSGVPEVGRQEIRAAISKAVELRALHAALMQGNSPANLRLPSVSSPIITRPSSQLSAQDYPVFTPTYEDEPLPAYHQRQLDQLEDQTLPEGWRDYALGGDGDSTILSDRSYKKKNSSSRKELFSSLVGLEDHTCPAEDHLNSVKSTSSANHHTTVMQTSSPGADYYNSKRINSLWNTRSTSSCNKCKPAIISSETEVAKSSKSSSSNVIVPLTDSHSSTQSQQPKSKGAILSWLFPRSKKKYKNGNSPYRSESEEVSQIMKDLGIVSVEALKKQLLEANENRDAALREVAEMKSSLGDLKQKLDCLESYCEGLRKALQQAAQAKDSQGPEKLGISPKRGKSTDDKNSGGTGMPVSEEVMVEGFLQIVSEARLSVKQFSKILVAQIEETDNSLLDNLNMLLQPYKLSLSSKSPKVALCHLEAIINQSLYQDFENCIFQKNGSPKFLDPEEDRQAQFSSFVALRNLSWNEVLKKGTKYYSEEFSKFCDLKMSCIISSLSWTRPWPEQLLQSFFVAAKCIWLLHLLAFSFDPPLAILRVDENRWFDSQYMEDIILDRSRSQQGPSRVNVMVMPGFYVQSRILRCKVLCKYKTAA